ncbi:MAG: hypothetical protein ACK5OX_11935 [Desertimonas sp.]
MTSDLTDDGGDAASADHDGVGTAAIDRPLAPDEVTAIVGAITTAAAPGGATPIQDMVVRALADVLTGTQISSEGCPLITPDQLAATLDAHERSDALRHRIVRYMSLVALLVEQIPEGMVERIDAYAAAMGLGTTCRDVLGGSPADATNAVLGDFARNGYADEFMARGRVAVLHTDDDLTTGWQVVDDDSSLARRWDDLADLPADSLGRAVHDFYRSRAFVVPGRPDSAPPLLAQHDWVHVLADFGTRVECEIEVFALIAESDDDPRSFSLLAMIIGLFATGSVDHAAGIFDADTGHLDTPAMATRLADALRRGSVATRPDGRRSGGLLASDWFAVADQPVTEVRRRCRLGPKTPAAVAAGSASTWSWAGLSDYQRAHCDLDVLAARAAEATGDGGETT